MPGARPPGVDAPGSIEEVVRELDFLEHVIATARAIVLMLDPDGRIVRINKFMEDLSGYSLEEVRGKDWFTTFLPQRDWPRVQRVFQRAVEKAEIRGQINPIVTRDGTEREIEWYGTTLTDEHGGVLGVISVGQDVTERLHLQARLMEAERLAAVGSVASVFAHEVGNPLNNMALHVQLLRRRIQKRTQCDDLLADLDVIMEEVGRLSRLLEDFRAFYRHDRIARTAIDVNVVLDEVLRLHGHGRRKQGGGVQVVRELGQGLPLLLADVDKLKQVLVNLCKNAVEAMPDGGTLTVRVQADETWMRFEIEDTGHGVDPEIDIYQAFRTTKPNGTGLGLPVVRQIVDAHGGTIAHSATPRGGTLFTVQLPLKPPD